MFVVKVWVASLFFVAVHGAAFFTNNQFDTVEVGKPFNVTWKGNKGGVSLELVHGDAVNLLTVEVIAPILGGNSFNWVPVKNLPLTDNVLKITDLLDREPNWSKKFPIKGANATWVQPDQEDVIVPTATIPEPAATSSTVPPAASSSNSPPPAKGGMPQTAKTAIYVAVPVVVIILAVCFWAWLRNRRNDSRLRKQPIRTMTTDNTPTRNKYDDRGNGPREPEKAARGYRSRSQTIGSNSTTSTLKKFFFNEKAIEPTIDQVSTRSTNSDPERDAVTPRHRTSSHNDKTLVTPPHRGEQRTTWDDSPTPPNNRTLPNNGIEMDASNERRYPRYNEPESPTPRRRVGSPPVLERGYNDARGSPAAASNAESQRWELSGGTPYQANAELSGGTPYQSNARLARPPYELDQNQRGASPPQGGSSSSSLQGNENRRQDLYAGVNFGESDDPDVIVQHLAAQREKVRAERERLRKMQDLDTVEEDLDRQINAARQRRG